MSSEPTAAALAAVLPIGISLHELHHRAEVAGRAVIAVSRKLTSAAY